MNNNEFDWENKLMNLHQSERLSWYRAMRETYENRLTEEEKDQLSAWEKEFVDGSGRFGTSDWPGWEKYLGLPPWITDLN